MKKSLFLSALIISLVYNLFIPQKDLSLILFPEVIKQLKSKIISPANDKYSLMSKNYRLTIPTENKKLDIFRDIDVDFISSSYKKHIDYFELNEN
ncbi:Uncharacterised protein [Phocoenobacter uteri]|uniref:Uncharacterized protein n=1 Tax=Phocoenobacter uteri TaxID=146806 RepID=A0A379C8S7_9PAST|nr:hypothetical protein [Phocoenobacter uteri]MDG6882470.1 hypothetical protein [Phocoenobacter uteri]SUB58631.1 Uncharacterised protein [Phocoenobacter uteri]